MMREKQGSARGVLSGLFWTAGGKGAQAILQFVLMAILARLMSPLEFGVVSAALIVIGFSEIITRLGFGPAIVQRAELERRHLETAFAVSVMFSFSIGGLIWLAAPAVAGFFKFEGIETVLRVLALLFPIRGLSVVAESVAQRELRFKWLAHAETICFIIGYFGFGVGLAWFGFGVWSLVAANLVSAAVKTAALLIEYPPPKCALERRAFRELIYFGGGFTLARLANHLALQGDNLVVGRTLGLAALGVYGRAYQLMSVPASLFGQVLDDVLFPTMAKMQHEKKRLAKIYLRGVSLIGLVMLPISVVTFILAPEIIALVLGADWAEVVLPFRILTVGLLFRTSYKMSDSLSRATGAVYSRAWRQTIYAASVIGGAWLGQFWGVAGVAAGVLAALFINFLLMAQMSLFFLGESWRNFLMAHKNAVVLAFFAGICAYPSIELARGLNLPPVAALLVAAAVLTVCFLSILKFASRRFLGEEALWMLDVLKKYVPDRFANKYSLERKISSRKEIAASDVAR